ncbi:hypothetical protein [Vibrio phage vB_VibM_83AMN]|nr:hypothetical protein [Vibrio phage vB_VibM_83AMN]
MTLQEILFNALVTLDPKNKDQWTASGEPKLEIINVLVDTDHKFTREEVNTLAPGFTITNIYSLDDLKQQMPEAVQPVVNAQALAGEEELPPVAGSTAQEVSDAFVIAIQALCDKFQEDAKPYMQSEVNLENLNNATAFRDACALAGTTVRNSLIHFDGEVSIFSSNFTTNATKNTQDSINGYLEAQKTKPRVTNELTKKYTYDVDNPTLTK